MRRSTMKKKTAVKKPRRRLKKTVRQSFAAILLVTAIAVAAIPVPENLAVNLQADRDAVTSPVAYVTAKDAGVLGTPPKNAYVYDPDHPEITEDIINKNIADDIKDEKLIPTEIVAQRGDELYLTWQFLYEPKVNNGRLCRYNDEFPIDEVDLGLQPNRSYFFVYQNAYDLYFSNPDGLNKPDDVTTTLSDMDNTKKVNGTNPKFYPTDQIVFNYEHIDRITGENFLAEEYQDFFNSYFKADYDVKVNSFKAYWKEYNTAYDAWIKDHPGDTAGAKTAASAAAGTPPEALSRAPSDINNDADKKKFFCEHNKILKGTTGYTLVNVADTRFNAAENQRVYVAHGGTVPEDHDYKDVNGYLVKRETLTITSIGFRAFAGVHNVKQIKIDENVRTIEQSAFEGARISRVSIGNAQTIGDRAFYGCTDLKEVAFTDKAPTNTIGAEAFYGSGINTKLVLPSPLDTIGHGAFAGCLDLGEVEFSDTGAKCRIGDYAFYGDTRLTNMNFARRIFTQIGKCAFAIATPSGDLMTDFHFPTEGLEDMDDYVLANRQGLKNVYFENYSKKIPTHTFYNCFNLREARFSDKCGAAYFDSELFKDVTTKEDDNGIGFCVYGPELFANSPALPRTSTWSAVRTDGLGIPYVYEKDGKKYYEMAMESDGVRYRYAASEDGTLISCALISENPGPIDLIIPDKIGGIKIERIGNGCFEDSALRKMIRSITIKNNSIGEIGDSVFRDLEKLKKVRIGDSVTKIGANAFAGCSNLVDVYFTKPAAGYEAMPIENIGNGAFVTTGEKLTFHGGIKEGYGPFVLAMNKDNLLRDPDRPNEPAVNICYQSLWDSDEGAHLTVLPDQATGEVTLLDYPKMKDLEDISSDIELQDYCHDMENYYYYTVYGSGGNNNNVSVLCTEYAFIWDVYRQGKIGETVILPDGSAVPATEEELEKRYGPWINPIYCAGAWKDYLYGSESQDSASEGFIADFLFKPIVAEAATDPTPYFAKGAHPYNFMDNYENYLTMDTAAYQALPDYMQVQPKEWKFIQATRDIYVPEGVKSIDVMAYKKRSENAANFSKYIKNTPAGKMYESTLGGAQPGLFSGYYKDYEADDDEREKEVRGNDTIESVILTAVETIPDYAFDSCEQLSRVEMPAAKSVGKLPFRDCGNLIHLTGSADYPAERGILYERHKDADGNDRYRIVECLLARGRSDAGDLAVANISPATDSLLSLLCELCDTDVIAGSNPKKNIPAIAEGAFEGCKYISTVNLKDVQGLQTIAKDVFKDCVNLTSVQLPGSVNKIEEDAFSRTNPPDSYNLLVTIYGREVDIADNAFTKRLGLQLSSYEDSATQRYAGRKEIEFIPLGACRVWFYDHDGTVLGGPLTVDGGTKFQEENLPDNAKKAMEKNHRPGYNFDKWMSDEGKTLDDPIENDMTIFVAQYTSDGTMVDGKCSVQFVHGRTGQVFSGRGADENDRYLIVPGTSFADPLNGGLPTPVPSPNPTEDGYTFLNEYRTDMGEVWTPETIINRNMTVLALFGQNGGNGNTSGGSTSGGSGNTSKNSGNTSKNTTTSKNSSSSKKSSSTSSSSTSSSSTSATSTTSSGVGQYTVFVEGGSGSGSYAPGTVVIISCYMPAEGMRFEKWTTESNGVALASTTMTTTTFTMPANNVTVKANYVEAPTTPTVAVNTGGGGGNGNTGNNGTTTNGNGSTQVDIEKPGISNRDLATANTNGSSDNFIVKISETDEATRAVAAALTNKYGTLDNILYYAMDISLYDSTGTTKISDTTGLSVDITVPIPDSLVAYGGNNMAGAVINGDQLESLNESFTTINGVPCIRFRATHFSPYTIYVDTGNLVEGMLDVTPKTGDPIHPKWFLSLGLACLSIILFLKKDKKVRAKA